MILATQILIWETIVGERDASFNHVSTGGYNAVLECVSSAHPLRSKILSYYNSMVTSVQNHTKVPSFCTRSSGSAKVNELEWNGSKYVVTTANGGKFQLDNLMPGVYTVTEQSIDKYVPQEVHRVTVVAGQVSKVNFNNVLKRGNLPCSYPSH